jgi:DNA repair exonuclease SbcCD ATPase subunit
MIPQRIKLSGFLCYQDEQEIAFDGSSLWMLAGLNGSGKSTVFDAVTYALFGHHRGGSQNAQELINKDRDGLVVEFDFLLDGLLYQARRTLKRTAKGNARSTQQVLRRDAGGNGHGHWQPVEDTGQRAGFDAWVHERIGLSYDTFTSSVLLLQGKAEKLLDSSPKGRSEVLASIVDLERYQRLWEKADTHRKGLKAKLEAVQAQFAGIAEVTDEQLLAADERIAAADDRLKEATAEVERWHGFEMKARQWADLQNRLQAQRQRLRDAERLLGDAPAIERDAARLKELRETTPHVTTIINQRNEAAACEAQAGRLTTERQRLLDRLREVVGQLDAERGKRDSLQNTLTIDEQKQRDLDGKLRKLEGVLSRVGEHDRQQAELSRLQAELARLPASPAAELQKLQRQHDQVVSLAPAVPLLSRLHALRADWLPARAGHEAAAKAHQAVKARGLVLKEEREKLAQELAVQERVRQRADDEASQARALEGQARTDLRGFTELEGAKVCRACGQPLTKAHFDAERAKRQAELAAAAARSRQAAAAQQMAQRDERALRERLADLDHRLQSARDEFGDQRSKTEQLKADTERLLRDLAQTYQELPEPFRSRVSPGPPADWSLPRYPAPADLEELRSQTAGLDGLRRRLHEATETVTRWSALQGRIDSARQALERVRAGLPDTDFAALQREQTDLQAAEVAVARQLKTNRAALKDCLKLLDRLTGQEADLRGQAEKAGGELRNQEEKRGLHLQNVERALKLLPSSWRADAETAGISDLNRWKGELEELERQGTEYRAQQLQQARLAQEPLRQAIAELERDAAGFPEEARQPVPEVQARFAQARHDQRTRDEELRQARQDRADLDRQRRQRDQLRTQTRELEREHNLHSLLAQLLGRDRLQRHLVRSAERQIVDHANGVLDRLSGGQLMLRLCGGDDGAGAEKALELEVVNRTTGSAPINVAFLSGSQRFRVAVSLALGIGQYASRQHRPIESVIIDEGFGCLDRQGRQVMIQELQNLRGHLHCILLVSHQEEFAEAFADGYRFELENGSTKVSRFQR